MKKESAAAALVFFLFTALPAWSADKVVLKTQKDKVSYAIGCNIGNDFKQKSIDINPNAFLQGMTDALAGSPKSLTDKEMAEAMMTLRQELQNRQRESAEKAAAKNKKEGTEFLAKNKLKEGVKVTPSGLQYKVIQEGKGENPKSSDTVTVHYRGTLIDGTEFDSSYRRNEPSTFPLSGVIRGWTEGLQLMKPGGTYELYIPSNLAYGERGAGDTIGPEAVLIFTVELISIKK
ncbi:FKBP-type peptidyl-prolyl cis-trans isomerase FklB [Syntrophus gentianae]|uniref:Peptidyl-prolyl cis-trans isomerase n=1 Tax=Syntrophus gentianae TaxID=43775 RepID=A0A1H7WBG1_9BACT|nr:FKBP-type peptidyl-prolyl cis-trans isomerase [Syntrophus gentianae]SEM18348.1 FKBP-type peptidyl-prolyl cis-trans isomerase FklB [Syntrophus gentianae]